MTRRSQRGQRGLCAVCGREYALRAGIGGSIPGPREHRDPNDKTAACRGYMLGARPLAPDGGVHSG